MLGTLNVVDAAASVGTTRFVQISTDKAVRPSSVMGASKRLAEQTVLAHAPRGLAYCTVRFGNVLGSRGSVIPTFARQIAQGGPVTVTDARMTRFFMSVEEAVQLVLQASVLSERRGDLHARHGGPGADPRPGRADDPAVRAPGGDRHPHRDHRHPPGREAQTSRWARPTRRSWPPPTPTSTDWSRSRPRRGSSPPSSSSWRRPPGRRRGRPCSACCSPPVVDRRRWPWTPASRATAPEWPTRRRFGCRPGRDGRARRATAPSVVRRSPTPARCRHDRPDHR